MPCATIQKCLDIQPIEGADSIEVATVMGWKVVVKKGEFKPGDYGVFIEIDSVVPERPEFEFLRDKHFRVRTVKLRGQISQGLFMPLSILQGLNHSLEEDQDVTEVLGITHYEKDIPGQLSGTIRGNFPTKYLSKTDETRIQSCLGVLYEMLGKVFYASVKMDGCSATYIHYSNGTDESRDVHVCSRNNSLTPNENNSFWQMEKKYDILNKLKAKGNFAIQAELCGPGIQGNKMGLKEIDLFVFNVFDIDKRVYLSFHEFVKFVEDLGMKTVPIVPFGNGMVWDKVPTIEQLLEWTKGTYENGHPREGIVIRPVEEVESRCLHGRLSFKIVNNDFLLKVKE